jgi:hypothetical protein
MQVTIDPRDFGMIEDPETGDLEPGPGLQDQLVGAIVNRLTDRSRNAVNDAVTERVADVVDQAVREKVQSVLDGLIQPVSHWNGKPEGDPFTIESMIETAVSKFLSASPSRRDSFSSNSKPANMADLIEEMVKETLRTSLKPAVDEAKKKMTNEIVKRALEGAASAIAPAVR